MHVNNHEVNKQYQVVIKAMFVRKLYVLTPEAGAVCVCVCVCTCKYTSVCLAEYHIINTGQTHT